MKHTNCACLLTAIAVLSAVLAQPCSARYARVSGPRGSAGIAARNLTGPYGGTFSGAAGAVRNAYSGLGGGAFKMTGPNGGSGQGGGVAGYRQGVGAFEGSNLNLKGPNGSTYTGYTRGKYNAQTGQGRYNASHQAYDAKNGKTYGDTNNTTYSNGQGVTQLNTDNHGDYTIDWGKGQQPVVTKDASAQ